MKPFDYMSYRMTRYTIRRTKEVTGSWMYGAAFVGGLQGLIVYDLLIAVSLVIGKDLLVTSLGSAYKVVGVLILAANYFRYGKVIKFDALDARWRHETPALRRKRWWLMFCAVVLIGLFPVVDPLFVYDFEKDSKVDRNCSSLVFWDR